MEEQEELLQEILKFIKQDVHCVYMRDITSHFARSTAWISDHFPVGSEGYSAISEALERNKSTLKEGLRHRLFDSASPQGQIALYKLLGTAEEKEALSTVINKNTEKQQVTLKID